MNSDTFVGYVAGTKRNTLLAQSGIGTAETILTMGADTAPVNAFVSIPQQTAVVGAGNSVDQNANSSFLYDTLGMMTDYRGGRGRPYFNSGSFNAHPFLIRICGTFTSSALDNTTGHAFNLKQNSTAVLAGANSVISAVSTTTLAAGSYNFLIESELIWDSVSQNLTGEAWGVVAGNYTARTSVNIAGVTSISSLLFISSAKFNTGAANVVSPTEFCISQV